MGWQRPNAVLVVLGAACLAVSCRSIGAVRAATPTALPETAPTLPLRGIAAPPAAIPVPAPSPGWPKPTSIPFPAAPNQLVPAFDQAQQTGLAIGLFGLGRPAHLEIPELTGLVTAAQTYLLEEGHTLFFQTDAPGNLDIWRYDLRTHLIDTLPDVNTAEDEAEFAVTLDARWLVFARGPAGKRRLARVDLKAPHPAVEEVPRLSGVAFPSVNADASLAAFTAIHGASTHIGLYDFDHAAVLTPPFLNSPHNESFPWLIPYTSDLAFVSDRRGNPDLFLADLKTGFVRTLVLANSPANELAPAYIGGTTLQFVSDRTGLLRMYTYDYLTGVVDTLPY
jgi:hypothetical protein